MAELVGGALLSAFFQALFDRLASEEILELFHGKKPLVELLDELSTVLISANKLLNDAEEKQIRDEQVKKWLGKLEEAIYDADDLVDTIDSEALRRKLEGEYSSIGTSKVLRKFITINLLDGFDNNVKNEATEILRRLKILVDQKDNLGLREGFENKLPSQRPPAPLVEESGVFGRKDDKEAIVNLLLSDDCSGNKISVIPIVGMGGIGKTTLAQLVYKDKRVVKHFELKAWVTVSEDFDIFKISKIIFEKVTSGKCRTKDLFELQQNLKGALSGKKFLFVHDDVWNENYHLWVALKSSFESGAVGSKIIVTTRSSTVASVMAVGPNHHLQYLSHEDCWHLFVKHAFGFDAEQNAYPDLQVIGREIVKKCKGLPLAVKSIGGLLRSERNPQKWESILQSDVWDVLYKEGNLLPALWLSYRHLPAQLKRCFAYCSIFPKDHEIEKERIVLLWMAEGFLRSDKPDKRMEELGEEYLEDLLSRSLFERSRVNESVVCMHDLVHDLAMYVSGEFCCKFDHRNDGHNITSRTRHLSYYSNTELDSSRKAKCLRTFINLSRRFPPYGNPGNPDKLDSPSCDVFFTTERCLRVFSLWKSSINVLPDSIGNLIHLRYLDLSGCRIRELPNSVCRLYHLQTLLLTWCINLTALPKNMERLVNLRHLNFEGVPFKEMPLQIKNMKALQTLSTMILGDGHSGPKIYEVKQVQPFCGSLEILGIENVVNEMEALEANLKHKKGLTRLRLGWSAEAAASASSSETEKQVLDALQPPLHLRDLEIVFYRGTKFPDWVGCASFSSMVKISLENCKNCSYLPPLGQLPSLEELTIGGLDCVVSIGDEFYGNSAPSFRSLKILTIKNMLEWKEWSFGENIRQGRIFPRLQNLRLIDCPQFNVGSPGYLPSDLEHLPAAFPSLYSILVVFCPLLESLLEWVPYSKLKRLELIRCEKLFENCKQWCLQRLSSLEHLNIAGWKSDSFPDAGQQLPTSLTSVFIQNCENLEALNGKAFQQLTSLERLTIRLCPKLQCLPEEGLPPSLSRLTIINCPLLKQRCQKYQGEDWPKIAHIANVRFEDEGEDSLL